MSAVSIHSEFQPLEEVIVGKAHLPESFNYVKDSEFRDGMAQILQETEEDLLELVKIIEQFGATVRRPQNPFTLGEDNQPKEIDLNLFDFTFPNHPLMPRDTVLIVGDNLIQTFTKSENRYFENWCYYDLFMEYFKSGARWTSMPSPFLMKGVKNYSDYDNSKLLFHAANFLKCGRDLFVSQPGNNSEWPTGKGTEAGLQWLKQQISEDYRIHLSPCAGHLDGKMALLKPGLVAMWDEAHLPAALANWDKIKIPAKHPFPEHFKKIKKRRFYKEFVTDWLSEWIGFVDETVFDVNMFSLSEELVITNGYNKEVYKQLKDFGVEAIPWNFRHQFFWDGAIHCVTLDIRRKGQLEDYFRI